ncbi:hypothetical protein H4Q26_008925 [Puccinia striiformis f. sp. tritici PST-130]|nr:hypothetical protein H4Q26_008925 [Puccinia striiformis f. sp. tritici PST-130]
MKKLKLDQAARVMVQYQSFCINALNIPSLQAYYMTRHSTNFVGKEFRVVLQAAPVVFFEYMLELQQDLWGALCQLLPLTFQTHIKDMSAYQQVLQDHIRWFLFQFAKSTAHSLFATKKFKSYNSVLRNASIHYNCRSPGHDIPVMFANILMERVHHEPQVRSCKVQPDTEVEPPVDSVEFLRGYKLDQIGDCCSQFARVTTATRYL